MPPSLAVHLLTAGYCQHPGFVVNPRRGGLAPHRFPALAVLLRHPSQGLILYDTGYAPRFFTETSTFPASLYGRLTPVTCPPAATVAAQLAGLGIEAADIRLVILSHFHADHVGGLLDFPGARLLYLRAALDPTYPRRPALANVRRGLLPGLLPPDLAARTTYADDLPLVPLPGLLPFTHGHDLLGDGSLLGIDVSGHAPGQLGLLLTTATGRPLFLVADACWTHYAYENLELPWSGVRLIKHDMRQYLHQLRRLHALHARRPEVLLVPSHCQFSIDQARAAVGAW